jgi:LAS seventeen-binding protein 5
MQLVEHEELIGTLIETNDRLMSALEMYDTANPEADAQDTRAITNGMAASDFGSATKSMNLMMRKERTEARIFLPTHTFTLTWRI